MPTLFNRIAAATAVTLTLLAAPAAAQIAAQSVPDARSRWVAEAQRSLEHGLADPRPLGKPSFPEGVVDIAFGVDAEGRTTRVSVHNSSGSRFIDRVIAGAVRRIRTTTPPPMELLGAQMYLARIYMAGDDRPLTNIERRDLAERAARKNGWTRRVQTAAVGRPQLLLASQR